VLRSGDAVINSVAALTALLCDPNSSWTCVLSPIAFASGNAAVAGPFTVNKWMGDGHRGGLMAVRCAGVALILVHMFGKVASCCYSC